MCAQEEEVPPLQRGFQELQSHGGLEDHFDLTPTRGSLICPFRSCKFTSYLRCAFCLRCGFGFHDDVSGAWTEVPMYTLIFTNSLFASETTRSSATPSASSSLFITASPLPQRSISNAFSGSRLGSPRRSLLRSRSLAAP
ncbi:phytochrome A-associated F-box protein [Spatholobus suberectus]|nr:phytochrome A-associated F-box protein [Spatholobus suberectus]